MTAIMEKCGITGEGAGMDAYTGGVRAREWAEVVGVHSWDVWLFGRNFRRTPSVPKLETEWRRRGAVGVYQFVG